MRSRGNKRKLLDMANNEMKFPDGGDEEGRTSQTSKVVTLKHKTKDDEGEKDSNKLNS
jgi:hypothetical protein